MAITALIENGKVISTGATTSSKSTEKGNNSVNEDMFLQLLHLLVTAEILHFLLVSQMMVLSMAIQLQISQKQLVLV